MTRPVTPLLYISHNKSELLELRKHVFIKDAHEGKNIMQELCNVIDAREITTNETASVLPLLSEPTRKVEWSLLARDDLRRSI